VGGGAMHADVRGAWGHGQLLDALLENFSIVMIVATLLYIKIVIPTYTMQ